MIEHNRGDTFDYSGQLSLLVDGLAVGDLTGWVGRSMVRTKTGTLVDELTFSWIDASVATARIRKQTTSTWPYGKAVVDIQLTSPEGDIVSTRAAEFEIVTDVTYD